MDAGFRVHGRKARVEEDSAIGEIEKRFSDSGYRLTALLTELVADERFILRVEDEMAE